MLHLVHSAVSGSLRGFYARSCRGKKETKLGSLAGLGKAFFAAFACLIAPWLTGCSADGSASSREPLPHEHRFELTLEGRTIHVQLAINQEESSRGLMHREQLEPDEGMLFVFPRPRKATFWMKNTPLPLDIGFFSSDGVLLEIHRMFPHDETGATSSAADVHLALEMNQGWFSRHKIRPGARLDLDEVRDAIRRRGMEPSDLGL